MGMGPIDIVCQSYTVEPQKGKPLSDHTARRLTAVPDSTLLP